MWAIRDSTEYDTMRRHSAASIVPIANALAIREGFATGDVDRIEIDAAIILGRTVIGVDDNDLENMIDGLAECVATVA